ncbi:MAG: EamA family transporter [Chthoniobacteraceae bacterium]
METWKIQAILAAIFAGLTSVLAKSGMKNLGPDVSLALRTCVVFTLVMINMLVWTAAKPAAALRAAQPRDLALLALSGLTTSLSWIFYYRAMKSGTVSFVSLVDKGSIIVTLLLSVLVLREDFTRQTAIGATLILAGIVVMNWKF